jgi:hypothetical protein
MTRFICLTYYHDKSPVWINPDHITTIAALRPGGYAHDHGARSVVNVVGDDDAYSLCEEPQDVAKKAIGSEP